MKGQHKPPRGACPGTVESARDEAQSGFVHVADFCQTSNDSFWQFEKKLFVFMAALGVCLIRLFLTARQQRLEVKPFLQDGKFRLGTDQAQRTLKTAYG